MKGIKMSYASEIKNYLTLASCYEAIGQSGATYQFFLFKDGSVCAMKKIATKNQAAAQWVLVQAKPCLRDCGITDGDETTYQKGQELLKRFER